MRRIWIFEGVGGGGVGVGFSAIYVIEIEKVPSV